MEKVIHNAMQTLSQGIDPSKVSYDEQFIQGVIDEAQTLSSTLFADRSRQHDKLEYVRAHFGTLLARILMATWRNVIGLDKEAVHGSLVTTYTMFLINKSSSVPCIVFLKQVLANIVSPSQGTQFTHELDEHKLKEYLRAEFDGALQKAPEEIRQRWYGKYEETLATPDGQETFDMAKKYLGLMAKIYYLIPKQ